jgi:two-component system, cell cycle sensor histidine kinase and response regulator CckA
MQEVNAARNESPKIVNTGDGRTKKTILLVDDEAMVRELMCAALQRQGYKVLPCSNPEEGIETSRQHCEEIDLLLTDVVMPGMNGCDMAKRIREMIPELRVVFMSGYTEHALTRNEEVDPQFEYLQKPFTLRALTLKLARVLGQE